MAPQEMGRLTGRQSRRAGAYPGLGTGSQYLTSARGLSTGLDLPIWLADGCAKSPAGRARQYEAALHGRIRPVDRSGSPEARCIWPALRCGRRAYDSLAIDITLPDLNPWKQNVERAVLCFLPPSCRGSWRGDCPRSLTKFPNAWQLIWTKTRRPATP